MRWNSGDKNKSSAPCKDGEQRASMPIVRTRDEETISAAL
jgi:hypothetical protein